MFGILTTTLIGIVFGLLISYGQLNKYNTIAGLSVLKDFTVAKTIMMVLGIGSILFMFEIINGFAVFQVKPLHLIGTSLGGILFGIGMSILGYCPGTMTISLGQGSTDALIGILGGITGGVLYTLAYPAVLLVLGMDLGKVTLYTFMGSSFSPIYITITSLIAIAMVGGSFMLHYVDVMNGITSKKWIVTAFGLAILNALLFYKGWLGRPLGASSCYPFFGDSILGITDNAYYPTTVSSGSWQIWFLTGAMIAGFIYAVATKTFRVRLIQERWMEYKGNSASKRIVWAFIGGVILIFGARMADGCTSGHIISGGMQIAVSSYIFAIFTFIGFLGTGYIFYSRKKK